MTDTCWWLAYRQWQYSVMTSAGGLSENSLWPAEGGETRRILQKAASASACSWRCESGGGNQKPLSAWLMEK